MYVVFKGASLVSYIEFPIISDREREDTVRCVVQSLTGDDDLFGELADGCEIEDEVGVYPL